MPLSFKNILSSKSNSFVGIDIGSSCIKIVQLRKEKGVAVLETYGSFVIGPYVENAFAGQSVNASAEVLYNALAVLMQETKITAKNASVAIPFHASLVSLIDIPAFSDERIAKIMPYEARRHIPIPLEEISLDWFPIPRELLKPENQAVFENELEKKMEVEQLKRKVLLIAINNNEMAKQKAILSRLNLKKTLFEIEIFSALRAILHEARIPTLIVDIGAQRTKFYVVDHGILIRSHFINQGGQTMTNAIASAGNISFQEAEYKKRKEGLEMEEKDLLHQLALVFDDIFSEIDNSLIDYEHKYRKTVGKIVFTGGGGSTKGLLEEAKKKLKVEVEIANPFGRLKHPAIFTEQLTTNGPDFSIAIGAALKGL